MNIFSKMGWSREDLQYRINRVWHNVKFSFSAVVCAVVGIAVLVGEIGGNNKVLTTLLLVACGCGYIYSIMMINNHEEDEYDVYAY